MRGLLNSSRLSAISTMRPRYITPMRVAMWRTTARLADEEIGQAELVLQVPHQIEDLRLHGDVERRGRLVADDELGIGSERTRNRDTLALAAGELMRKFRAVVGMQADERKQLADAIPDRPLAFDQVEGAYRLGHDGIDPKTRVEARIGILEYHLDAAAQPLTCLRLLRIGHGDAVDHDLARGWRQQPDHHARHRSLARAGFNDERKGLALPDVEADAVDGLEVFEMAAFQHAIQPRLGDVEHAAKVSDVDKAHAALSFTELS